MERYNGENISGFKTEEKATGNHSILLSKKACQLTDNKRNESI